MNAMVAGSHDSRAVERAKKYFVLKRGSTMKMVPCLSLLLAAPEISLFDAAIHSLDVEGLETFLG